ncbi:MAG: sugar phosphate nucleotidyltransferase [Bacteroidota bacterium]
MAGRGTRMLPHTLHQPKGCISLLGKPIVAHQIEQLQTLCAGRIADIGFVLSQRQPPLEAALAAIAQRVGARPHFYTQPTALGTAHAISCASSLLAGEVLIAFVDTLFEASVLLDNPQENIIWVKQVENPSAFGVVVLDKQQRIVDFVEKPTSFVSPWAMVGLYYFREGYHLHEAIQACLARGILQEGEYPFTAVLAAMQKEGRPFATHTVDQWLDCGNKAALLHAHQHLLSAAQQTQPLVAPTAQLHNSLIVPPVYLGEKVSLDHAIVGPYVSVGDHSQLRNTCIQHSIVQEHTLISHVHLQNSTVGSHVTLAGQVTEWHLADYATSVEHRG